MLRSLVAVVIGVGALGCAADDGSTLGRTDAGARDTGVRVDRGGPVDTGPAPIDRPVVPNDVGFDAGPTPIDIPPPMDLGQPVDRPVTPQDTGPSGMGLLDVYQGERDAGDPTPRNVDQVVNNAPADSATRFSGTETSGLAPTIVYPSPDTILPPNLTGFEVHFRPAAGQDLFEVSFTGDRGVLRLYTPCVTVGAGCGVTLDESAYREFARVAYPSGNVAVLVRGVNRNGSSLGRSASRTVQVTNTDIRGGIYYWNASASSILRFEWGRVGARPENFLQGDPFNCVGCHTLSRDGTRAAVGRFIPGPAVTRVYDVSSRNTTSGDMGSNFATFSPDNRHLIISNGSAMGLRDGTTGATVPGLAEGTPGSMPDWSRDGRTVVFARTRGVALFGQPGHNPPGDLFTMQWSGSAFAAPQPFVMSSGGMQNHFYPGVAPDDQWVVFNRAEGESYHNIRAQLWAARLDRSLAPVRLTRADGTGEVGNSWPKWAPFVQTFRGEPLLWVTFSSRRDYGLRLVQQDREVAMRTSQLWMAAFRPNVRNGDPSGSAFWLPFQDIRSGNHIAQWSEQVQRTGCTADRDCRAGERCVLAGTTSQTLRCVPQ